MSVFLLFTHKTHYVFQIHLTIDVLMLFLLVVLPSLLLLLLLSQYTVSFVRSFNRLFMFNFHWASQTKCMTCIYEVLGWFPLLLLLLSVHVVFSSFHYSYIAGLFHFIRCILMLAALSLKFRGSRERNS